MNGPSSTVTSRAPVSGTKVGPKLEMRDGAFATGTWVVSDVASAYGLATTAIADARRSART